MVKGILLGCAGLFLLLFATACTAPKPVFVCKRDPGFSQKLDRVLLVSMNEEQADATLGARFSESVAAEIATALTMRGVQVQVTAPDPKQVDPDESILRSMAAFQPHQVLQFGVTRINMGRYVMGGPAYRRIQTEVATVVFEAKLKDIKTHKTVWRAEMSYWFEPEPAMVAKAFVDKLVAENFVNAANR